MANALIRFDRWGWALALSLSLGACTAFPRQPVGGVPQALQQQVDRAGEIGAGSADNALTQARVAYGALAPRLATMGQVDLDAFQAVRTTLQPPMLVAANALAVPGGSDASASDVPATVSEFRQLYTDSLEQMLNGINNNLQIYQAHFERSQAVNATPEASDRVFVEEAMGSLGNLFQATEVTEHFAAELGQFSSVLPAVYTQTVLEGVRRQQATIINGVITFTALKPSAAITEAAYQAIARSLTNPNLLGQFQRLAIAVYGTDKVAYRQDELTPAQPNPNLIVMVVQEAPARYRLVSMANGRLVNQVVNDTRGLSAADLLQQTNVVRLVPAS